MSLEDIRKRDEITGDLWFTGPPSFTALAARDRRELLEHVTNLEDLLKEFLSVRHLDEFGVYERLLEAADRVDQILARPNG